VRDRVELVVPRGNGQPFLRFTGRHQLEHIQKIRESIFVEFEPAVSVGHVR
jgi:hypothetical protein